MKKDRQATEPSATGPRKERHGSGSLAAFLSVLRRFAMPYKGYMAAAVGANLMSALLNVFSFMSIMPMLNMLFGMDTQAYHFQPWQWDGIKDIAINNIYYYTIRRRSCSSASSSPRRHSSRRRATSSRRQ